MDGGLRSDADGWQGDAARSHEETADCPPFGNFLCYLSLSHSLSLPFGLWLTLHNCEWPPQKGPNGNLSIHRVNDPLKKGPMA